MLAKLSAKNQVTLPVDLLRQLPAVEYFEAALEGGAIVLRPVRIQAAADVDLVRDRLAAAGVTEDDIVDAVRFARRGKSP